MCHVVQPCWYRRSLARRASASPWPRVTERAERFRYPNGPRPPPCRPASPVDGFNSFRRRSDWDFRAVEGGVLVGFFTLPPSPYPAGAPKREAAIYSSGKYLIQLPSGRVQTATESQWNTAPAYVVFRDSARWGPSTTPDGHLHYQDKQLSRGGAQWPRWAEPARSSSDGSYLAVHGWDGVIQIASELALFQSDPSKELTT